MPIFSDLIPNFNGDLARENWFIRNAGPRNPQAVEYIIRIGLEEAESYSGNNRIVKRQMYDVYAPLFQRFFDRIIFTDGSLKRSGTAGYGAWWGNEAGQHASGPVPEEQSSFHAELYGVYQAFLHDSNCLDAMRIETDCIEVLSVLHACANHCGTRYVELSNRILEVMLHRPGPIGFGYVPGHTNVYGNDSADRLAGEASWDAEFTHPGLRS